jgi:gluconate 2-dehydrogenase gamma chain
VTQNHLSRRELLKRAGIVGTAAVIPAAPFAPPAAPSPQAPTGAVAPAQAPAAAPTREALVTLSAAESDILEAIVARLIPTDEHGPGAAEARAANYIDRALAGPLASSREAYRAGLQAIDAYAQAKAGASFVKLSAKEQDAVLTDMEHNVATGFKPNSLTLFNLVRAHTIDGTFCDPYYGGNANFIGWDLIGYPGVRLAVTANEQKMGVVVPPTHRSAYDFALFSKARATAATAADEHAGAGHGN